MKRETAMNSVLLYDVSQHGTFLATRNTARKVRESLEDIAASLVREEVLIDFSGVAAMTISFADEFLGKFYTSVAAGDVVVPVVLLRGLNEDTEETISICLQRRELLAAAVVKREIRLIAAPEFLVETYRHATGLRKFRASDLSERLGITLSNVNNRLKRLAATGTLRRERSSPSNRGGKEFVYSVPCV